MKKFFISILACLALIFGALGLVACNTDSSSDSHPNIVVGTKGLEYKKVKDEQEFHLVGLGSATETDIVVASHVYGFPVTKIADEAFKDCDELTSVTISNNVTSIGEKAFYGCDNLISVSIPESVNFIGANAFYCCHKLTSVNLPNGITSIENYTFYECWQLINITIPDSVTSIGDYAFYSCESLAYVTIPNSVTSIGNKAFYLCGNLTAIYCERETMPDGWNSTWNLSNYPIIWDCKNNELADNGYIYTTVDGIRYMLKDTSAIVIRQSADIVNATIPNAITYKGASYSVFSIGSRAFYRCENLTNITIPDSVTSIGNYAFLDCKNLTNITIPDSVTSIDADTFYRCENLTSITIGNGVASIGARVFDDCYSLKTIIFNGTIEEWNLIEKKSWGNNVPATEVVCTDGKVTL